MSASDNDDHGKSQRVVLPTTVVPTRYKLHVKPDMTNFTFQGVVTITMTSKDEFEDGVDTPNKITLHAKELSIRKAEYTVVGDDATATAVAAEEILMNLKTTTVTFTFPTPVPKASTIALTITYDGIINDQMAGFYRSSYKDHFTGETHVIASTQFEALDARRAFPCVDEPAAKAIFQLLLTVPSNLECLANMPEASRVTNYDETTKCTTTTVTFLDSPKMSTYLLAFCVLSNFDFIQGRTLQTGVLVRVYCPRGRTSSATYALECGTKCLDKYDDFFGLPYPLPKCDMIAVPEFAMGAMENWGLVTYRDVDLLIDPNTASNAQKQRVATVVCHELAHQWFGNLVTMEWWDDLWLNEGFASWAENWSSDLLYPSYRMWDQFVTDHFTRALKLDGLQSSHPIQVPIKHAEEVEQVFDAISYCKGASVVRMIQAVMGMAKFQKGLQEYMKRHQYGNTITLDLWTAWEQATQDDNGQNSMPIREMMASWTEQMGFPIVKVVKEEQQGGNIVLELEQSWFLADGTDPSTIGNDDATKQANGNKLWTIPVLTCTKDGTQPDMILIREKTATVTLPISGNDNESWIKLNAGQEVPMRVQYTPTMWKRLAHAVSTKQLSPADRVGLIGDAYALVKAKVMKPEDMMTFLSAFSNEDNCIVWQSLSEALGGLELVLSSSSSDTGRVLYQNFVEFGRKLVLPLVDLIGWEDKEGAPEDHLTSIFRGIMVSMLSVFCSEDPSVAKEVQSRCKKFLDDPVANVSAVPTDIKTPVFKMFVKSGGAEEYEQLKAYYYKAKDNAERKHVLNSLGNTKIASLQLATMEWTTFSGDVKLQDFFYGMGSVGRSSKQGQDIAWKFFKDNLESRIKPMLKSASPSLLNAVIVMCAGSFCSKSDVDQVEHFFQEHPLPNSARRIAQLVESLRSNVTFLDQLEQSELSNPDFWKQL